MLGHMLHLKCGMLETEEGVGSRKSICTNVSPFNFLCFFDP